MARELTSQETQILSRIRDRMADAARDMADAIRTRRLLEAQLREVQHQMASPDGIASSQQFVDDVSRLRREIQTAIAREQEADTTRSRLSAEEMRVFALPARKQVEPAGLNRTQRADATSPTGGVSIVTAGRMKSGLDALRRAQAQYARNSAARGDLEKKLANNIKKTILIVFVAALFVATLADILSFFDFGWVVSWAIPMIVWFMVRRVTAINKGGDAIVGVHATARRQLTLLQQRLRPALQSSGNIRLLVSTKVEGMAFAGKSYVSTFVRDTIITQLIELIPIIDVLPLYIGQVIKVFVDQNIAYQKVKKLMPHLEHVHQQIDRLEQFEIQYVARQIATVVRAQQLVSTRQRQQMPITQPRETQVPSSLALGYAT